MSKHFSEEFDDASPGSTASATTAQEVPTVTGLPDIGESHHQFSVLANYLADWETWESPEGQVIFVTPACQRISGFGIDNFKSNPRFIEGIMHPEDLAQWRSHRDRIIAGSLRLDSELRIRTATGDERWLSVTNHRLQDSEDNFLGIRSSLRDITDKKNILKQLWHQACYDPLTSLPNRTLCLDRLGQRLASPTGTSCPTCAVAFLDIDRFKLVNDTLGNAAGDYVLKEVAQRIGAVVSNVDTVSRLGSDEFVILIEELHNEHEAAVLFEQLYHAVRAPLSIQGRQLRISVSLGVVLSNGGNADDVLRNAHIAMQDAKKLGGDRVSYFHPAMLTETLSVMQLEMDMHRAFENKEFHLLYQPIVSTEHRCVTGLEALLRWRHPERGDITPDVFIPLAERSGFIHKLGLFALREACKTMAHWHSTNRLFRDLVMHVNLSPRQLSQSSVVEQVDAVLRETGLPASCLKLEVTETMLMEKPDYANVVLRRLRELGVSVCVDDFGTGYSSLSYLQRFPIDTLKVDRSFVSRMTREPGQYKIVQAVVALAHSLGLEVVAEGVENEEQRIMLLGLECDLAQGFLFSRPISADEILCFIMSPATFCCTSLFAYN